MPDGRKLLDAVWIGLKEENDMTILNPVDLTASNLAGYGRLLSETGAEAMADNDEFTYWGRVNILEFPSPLSTGLLVCKTRDSVVSQMERHIRTPEILTALSGDSVIVLAENREEGPEFSTLKAFRVRQGQSFVMESGTWHWIPYPKDNEARFLVLFAEKTEDEDLEIIELQSPVPLGSF
jgi:ureidoglycolate hydrolase